MLAVTSLAGRRASAAPHRPPLSHTVRCSLEGSIVRIANRQVSVLVSVLAFSLILLAMGCSDDAQRCLDCPCGPDWTPPERPAHNSGKVTIQQGIWGDVWFWQGNFMPGCPTGTVSAVARELRIHELTNLADVEVAEDWTFYTSIHTRLVAVVHSDETGFFEIELPPGAYSLFSVEHDTLFFANGFDGLGNIYPVHVKEGQVSDGHFDITYMSAW